MFGGLVWLWSLSCRIFLCSWIGCRLLASCSWCVPICCVFHVLGEGVGGYLLLRFVFRILVSIISKRGRHFISCFYVLISPFCRLFVII